MRPRHALALAVLSLLAACNDAPQGAASGSPGKSAAPSGKPAASAAAPKAEGRPQKALTVTVDGKPVEIVTALAFQDEGRIKIEMSSAPLGCADYSKNGRLYADGEVAFSAWFKPALQKDGTLEVGLDGTWFEGMSSSSHKPAKVTGDGSDGKPTTAEMEFETESAGKDKQKLVVKGKVDALGCPAVKPAFPQPEPPPPTDLMLEVAGKKLAVRTATVEEDKDGDRRVSLYTGGESCKPSGRTGDLTLIVWFKKGKPWQLTLTGGLLPTQLADQTFDEKKVKVKLPEKGDGDVDLAIDEEVMGYPVKLKGKIAAKDCATK